VYVLNEKEKEKLNENKKVSLIYYKKGKQNAWFQ
jgi:hypothetical protein